MHENGQRRAPPSHAITALAALADKTVRSVAEAVAAGHPADATLARFFREHREFGSRDRRFLGELVFSFFRWKGWTAGAEPVAALVVSHLLDATTLHPVTEALARKTSIAPADLVPAGDRPLEEKAAPAARWLHRALAPAALVPDWLPGSLPPGPDLPDRCLRAFQKRPPTWLRIARESEARVLDALAAAGIGAQRHRDVSSAVAITGSANLRALDPDIRSRFEVQDLASQCVGILCDPKPGDAWWDACAGSGGKALHLADLMGNRGTVVASDIRENALQELEKRARAARASCIRVGAPQHPFDGVLVDAPCSGIGTWSRNPDARWRTSIADVRARAGQQREILDRAASHVRPGGLLVYSVCTITAAESSGVIDAFLEAHPAFDLEPAPHPLAGGAASSGRFWIWPWDGPGDGMFVARMRKREADDARYLAPPRS